MTTDPAAAALLAWCARDEFDAREHDLLILGARVTLDLFTENHRSRGELRRRTIIDRAERTRQSVATSGPVSR